MSKAKRPKPTKYIGKNVKLRGNVKIWHFACLNLRNSIKIWNHARVMVRGKKAVELLRLILPYLEGGKKPKARYLLRKHDSRTSLPVGDRLAFRPFGGLE